MRQLALILFVFLSFSVSSLHAENLSVLSNWPVSTWSRGGKAPASNLAKRIYSLEKSASGRRLEVCKTKAKKIIKQNPLLNSWASSKLLFCEWKAYQKSKDYAQSLKSQIERIDKEKLLDQTTGSQVKLKEYYKESLVSLASRDKSLTKQDVLVLIKRLSNYKKLSLSEQKKLNKARKRVGIELETLKLAGRDVKKDKDFKKIKSFYRKNNWLAFAEEGRKFIAQTVDKIKKKWVRHRIGWGAYKLLRKKHSKFDFYRNKYFKEIKKADASSILHWSKYLMGKARYDKAAELAVDGADSHSGNDAALLYLQAGFCFLHKGDYEKSLENYSKAVKQASIKDTEVESLFRRGLLHIRLKRFSLAKVDFESLLNKYSESRFDMRARYWYSHSLNALKDKGYDESLKSFLRLYPMTYYGLKLRVKSSRLKWPYNKINKVDTVNFKWTEEQLKSFKRYKIFLASGLLKNAEKELELLPEPQAAAEKLIFSNLWAKTYNYFKSIVWATKAWDDDVSLMRLPYLNLAYPQNHKKFISKSSKRFHVDKAFIQGLIKQESSYQLKAVSPSRAMGLMQLIPSTAKEMGRRLNYRRIRIPSSLFDPETNVKLGTFYINTLIRAFNGHIPLALAAYNVGIGNMRKWLGSREELKTMEKHHDKDNDIWIDELPWSETSFYVKAVLRNYLMYSLIDKGELKVSRPIWADIVTSGRK